MNTPDRAGPRIEFDVNGQVVAMAVAPGRRLSDVLRDELGLTGTKVGCNAGDCGACTVLLDDRQVNACLVAVGQCAGRRVSTVEDPRATGALTRLQRAFVEHGAAQCGICTPGMLMASVDTLQRHPRPTEQQVLDGIGGVLCRCTGYRKIVEAVMDVAAAADARAVDPTFAVAEGVAIADAMAGGAVGARIERLDGRAKVSGSERFGADEAPADCLWLRIVRSPHPSAAFEIGDVDAFVAVHPGLVGAVSAADIPRNGFAIFPELRDQPALADGQVRFRGEAVLALAGSREAIDDLDLAEVPLRWLPRPALESIDAALADGAPAVQQRWPDNVLCRGRVVRGDVAAAAAQAAFSFGGTFTTTHVEHAYIEPEAGWARWDPAGPPTVTVFACTQTPYMDRDEIAHMFALDPPQVRIVPSAVGGGFGGKLDLSIQPLLVAASRKFGRPVRIVYSRPESMISTTKRHPSTMRATLCVGADGSLLGYEFGGDFDTGAYSSWGPTVANRVPIHACGPYRVAHVRALTRAVITNGPVAGAFRGFGVPQSTLLSEALIDEAAHALGRDPLLYRWQQALRAGDPTSTGQVLRASVGLASCLVALWPGWERARDRCKSFNHAARGAGETVYVGAGADPHRRYGAGKRRGVGIACMWYGIGNTVIANPSAITVGLRPDGRFMLYNGAVDIGQGTCTVIPQICADALGVPLSLFDQIHADTALTLDAGKSSASRQTFVSGNAAKAAGEDLRQRLASLLGLSPDSRIGIEGYWLFGEDHQRQARLRLDRLPRDRNGDVAVGRGDFNPPTVPLDADGQGVPYATYGFAAQFAEVEVDVELGTVRVLSIEAAHDVGRAINPTLVEGQIHGGIAQGLGMALFEEYRSGRTDNLHDYLIPTAGDVPPIVVHLIEDPEPIGPYGAKGVGEPALIATAPAIMNAIRDAIGVRLWHVPATPDRVLAALQAQTDRGGR